MWHGGVARQRAPAGAPLDADPAENRTNLERTLAGSGSYARGDQPRSVPDELDAPYRAMVAKQRAYNAQRHPELALEDQANATKQRQPDPEHVLPDAIAAHLVDVFGAPRRAREEWVKGNKTKAIVDGGLSIPDLYLDGAAIRGALKSGGVKLLGPYKWRTAPWKGDGARKWLGEKGFLNPGEHGHHAFIPNNGWGKIVPDFVKNQPWNIKGLDAVTHGRVHGPFTVDGVKLPGFNAIERLWHGTTPYFKAAIARALPEPERNEDSTASRNPKPPVASR